MTGALLITIATIANLLRWHVKKRSFLLCGGVVAGLAMGSYLVLRGQPQASSMAFGSALTSGIFIAVSNPPKWLKPMIGAIAFLSATWIYGFAPLSLIAASAFAIGCMAQLVQNLRHMRVVFLVATSTWWLYHAVNGNLGGVVLETVTWVSNAVAIARNRKWKNETQS